MCEDVSRSVYLWLPVQEGRTSRQEIDLSAFLIVRRLEHINSEFRDKGVY